MCVPFWTARFDPAFAAAFEYLVLGCLSVTGCHGEVMGAVLWTLEGTILKALDLDEFCSALADHCMLT